MLATTLRRIIGSYESGDILLFKDMKYVYTDTEPAVRTSLERQSVLSVYFIYLCLLHVCTSLLLLIIMLYFSLYLLILFSYSYQFTLSTKQNVFHNGNASKALRTIRRMAH